VPGPLTGKLGYDIIFIPSVSKRVMFLNVDRRNKLFSLSAAYGENLWLATIEMTIFLHHLTAGLFYSIFNCEKSSRNIFLKVRWRNEFTGVERS